MKIVTIRGIDFSDKNELHDFLASQLEFPEYYGRNLDALYDVLTDLSEETKIIIDMSEPGDDEMAAYLGRVTKVITDAAAANESVKVEVLF